LANDSRRPIPRGRARSKQPAYFFFFAAFFFVAFFFAAFFFAIENHLLGSIVLFGESPSLTETLAAAAGCAAQAAQAHIARAMRVASTPYQQPPCHEVTKRRSKHAK
jgi:hypothetical protein